MIIAIIIAIIVANFSAIIPESIIYTEYEQIAIIVTAIAGLITNFLNVKFNFISLLSAAIVILNAIKWHTTEAQAAPFTPKFGFGTKIKFKISLAITPTS